MRGRDDAREGVKLTDAGAEGERFVCSKHCIRGHNHSCNLGEQAPKPRLTEEKIM